MKKYEFDWDLKKAKSNLLKHRVSFEEATTVFSDPLAKIFDDHRHSILENREIVIGRSLKGQLLVVAFVEKGKKIRLISARETTKRERKDYEENIFH